MMLLGVSFTNNVQANEGRIKDIFSRAVKTLKTPTDVPVWAWAWPRIVLFPLRNHLAIATHAGKRAFHFLVSHMQMISRRFCLALWWDG
ncbi:MAG: hypothetical protein ACHP8B_03435 [Terriglobales bacterium]